MKKVLILSLFVFAFSSLCFAQNLDIGQRIIGFWVDNEDEFWLFGTDGKLFQDGERFKYSITDTQLSLLVGRDNIVCNFSMSSDGKTLILSGILTRTLKKTYNTPVSLTEGKWVSGSIKPNTPAIAYTFNVVKGKTYYIWTNDESEGDGSKTLDIYFVFFDENDVYNADEDDDCWSDPFKFTASGDSRVTIVVMPYDDDDESGTFAIAYSTSAKRP